MQQNIIKYQVSIVS